MKDKHEINLTVLIVIILLLCISLLSCINKIDHLVLKNVEDMNSTARCFIYVDIENKGIVNTIVVSSSLLYGSMRHYMYNDNDSLFSIQNYKKAVFSAIKDKVPIKVNDTLQFVLEHAIVNKELIMKYDTIDILNRGYILPTNRLMDSIDKENEKAIIYTLIRKELMNCCADCESGRTFFIKIE